MKSALCPLRPLALLLACTPALPTFAQTPNQPSEDEQIEVITITTRGVTESLQDSPIAIEVIQGERLHNSNITGIEEGIRAASSVNIHSGGDTDTTFMWIRGTGALTHTSLDDNSIDVRIDGVSNSMLGLSRTLLDVQRIEIAKGPQGTLYGQSAEAGLVNVTTFAPQADFSAYLGAGIGSDGLREFEAMINAPLGEQWGLRVAGKQEAFDNPIQRRDNGEPLNRKRRRALQAKLAWDNRRDTDATLALYYDQRDNYIPLPVLEPFNTPPVISAGNLTHSAKRRSSGLNLTLNHDFDFATLTSISAFHQHQGEVVRPYTPLDVLPGLFAALGIPAPLQAFFTAYYDQDQNNLQQPEDDIDQWSQELSLASSSNADLQWVAGLYLLDKERDFDLDARRELLLDPAGNSLLPPDPSNATLSRSYAYQSQALYGELTYALNQQFSLISGLRYTRDQLDYSARWTPNSNSPFAATGGNTDAQTLDDNYLSGRVGARYQLNSGINLYALYSRGHKASNFADYSTSIFSGQDRPYKAARINAFELGSKYAGLDGRLQLTAALYRNKIKDDHVTVVEFPSYRSDTRNVDTQASGAELDISWQATAHWQVRANLAYTDTEITRVPTEALAITQVGNRMPQVPKVSGNLGVSYTNSLDWLSNADWYLHIDLNHTGDRPAEPNNLTELDAYTLLNVNIGINSSLGELRLWAKNLTDEDWTYFTFAGGGTLFGMPARGRTAGVNYRYRF